jgi:two-component system, OmpR family, sensor histidine kinase KdpD
MRAMDAQSPHRIEAATIAVVGAEIVASVAVVTGVVALLDEVAPVTGLGILYILAVLFIAVRRGQVAALATSVLSVLALNFFFIEPRYRLTIADSHNVVALGVFLVVALVVGRLAATARTQTAEAERRALLASAREREAMILAQAASSFLAGEDVTTQLERLADRDGSTGPPAFRAGLTAAPDTQPAELAVRIPATRPGWLYGRPDAGWDLASLDRLAQALARLIDLARERELLAERSAAAEAARRADATKTALLHAISHDLRSPLTAITTAASGLRQEGLSADDHDGLLEAIEAESARLARMVDDLLDLSRIEAGAVNPRTDWADLADAVGRAAEQVERRFGRHRIELDLPADLPLVRADVAQLERVFSNLLENAVKFSPDGAAVRVSGGSGGGRVTVRVTDSGPGIPMSRRSEIFEPFVRGTGPSRGSGLGLAICRGLVEANGGEISLQGAAGKGSTFAVTFPLAAQPVEAR